MYRYIRANEEELIKKVIDDSWVIRNNRTGKYLSSRGGWTKYPEKMTKFATYEEAFDEIYRNSHYGNSGAEDWEEVKFSDITSACITSAEDSYTDLESDFIKEAKALARSDYYRYHALWEDGWTGEISEKIQPTIYYNKGTNSNTLKFEFNGRGSNKNTATRNEFKSDILALLNEKYPELNVVVKDSGARSPAVSVLIKH